MPVNTYHNTNNHYHMDAPSFQSNIIQYDRPKFALVEGSLKQLYGMLFIVECDKTEEEPNKRYVTFRKPLIGPELKSNNSIVYQNEGHDMLWFLPENKCLTTAEFKEYVSISNSHSYLLDGLDKLNKYGFTITGKPQSLDCYIQYVKGRVSITSDLFSIEFKNGDKDFIKPDDLYELLWIYNFLKIPFRFLACDNESKVEVSFSQELQRLLDAYDKDNIYTNNHIDNVEWDGTFAFSNSLGKIPMTREEFFKKFPDAEPMVIKR